MASPSLVDTAARFAAKLATATAKGAWVDYVVALYTAARRPCPAPLVDELHAVVRKTSAVDLDAIRSYVDLLRENSSAYGPADRFLVQRIEGLERYHLRGREGVYVNEGFDLRVDSEPGKGTTFRLYVPQATETKKAGALSSLRRASSSRC